MNIHTSAWFVYISPPPLASFERKGCEVLAGPILLLIQQAG